MTRMLTFDTPKRLIKKMSGSGITGGSNVCAASGPHVAMEETDVWSFPHNHGIHYNQSTAANTTSHKGCHLAKASVRRESLHLMPLTTRTATVDALTGLNQTGDCSCPLTKYIYCISSVQIMRFILGCFFCIKQQRLHPDYGNERPMSAAPCRVQSQVCVCAAMRRHTISISAAGPGAVGAFH